MNYQFGPFQVLPSQRILLEHGKPVRLGSRAFDLLVTLIERAGDVVSKDDLVERVWSRQFVEDTNLRVHIGVLRKALGCGTGERRYISNVPGRGYLFVGAVSTENLATVDVGHSNSWIARPPLVRMVGRADAVNDVLGHLVKHRIVTITGPGGIGKTTVALAVADILASSHDSQVFFIDLAPLTNIEHVVGAVVTTIGLPVLSDNPLQSLLAAIRDRRLLLVLDSCEHLIESIATICDAITANAPNVAIVATSREPMHIEREKLYRLGPLAVPMEIIGITASEALGYPSVQLFVERVAAEIDDYTFLDADAPLVANICRRLDGIALAIELAAGRVEAFGVQGVADQLEDRLDLLARGFRSAIPRHQTLAAAIGWSYDVLSEQEKSVLQRLSIFPSGFTLKSALEMSENPGHDSASMADVIASLVGKSLISVNTERLRTEYRLLDTTRVYARQKLAESGQYQTVSLLHACYVRSMLGTAAENSTEPNLRWPADYGNQVDNLRAALSWSLEPHGDVNIAVALIVSSMPLWIHLSLVQECRTYVGKALSRQEQAADSDNKMVLYAALAMSQMYIGSDMRDLDAAWSKVLQLSVEIGDEKYRARAIWGMSSCHLLCGKVEGARRFANQYRQLCEISDNSGTHHIADRLIGQACFYQGDFENARRHLEAVVYRFTSSSEKLHVLDQRVMAQSYLSQLLWITGYPDLGQRLMEDALKYARDMGHAISVCWALSQSACHISRWLRDDQLFASSVEELVEQSQRYGLAFMHAPARCYKGQLMIERGDLANGLIYFQNGFEEFRRNSIGLFRDILCDLALTLRASGDLWKANLAIDEAMAHFEQNGELWYYPECLRIKGEIKLAEGLQDEAVSWFRKALAAASRMGALSWELRIATSLAGVQQPEPDVADAIEQLIGIYDRFSEGFESADLRQARALIEQRANVIMHRAQPDLRLRARI